MIILDSSAAFPEFFSKNSPISGCKDEFTRVISRVGLLFSAHAEGHVFLSLIYRQVINLYICCDLTFETTSGYQLPVLNVNWTDLLEKIRVN